jgi:1,4-dihydroxy-2-naphthoyl-CoA hydrolase
MYEGTIPMTLIDALNIEVIESTKTRVEMVMPITAEVHQPFGLLHGGATIALLESAASLAATNLADLKREQPFGIEVSVRHRKSGKQGQLRGVAELDYRQNNKQFWKVCAFDDEGDIISDGVIMTKIVTLERLAEIEQRRAAKKETSHRSDSA